MTYMLLLNCALKLVKEIILYYDDRSKKHIKKTPTIFLHGIGISFFLLGTEYFL